VHTWQVSDALPATDDMKDSMEAKTTPSIYLQEPSMVKSVELCYEQVLPLLSAFNCKPQWQVAAARATGSIF
jgi:hypothetical protein